jgi:hypothetical protein
MRKVIEVEKDAKGLVRTVMVAMRPRDSREKSLPYRSKKLKTLKLAVQRWVLVYPAQEEKDILKAEGAKNLPRKGVNYNAIIGRLVVLSEEGGVETPEDPDETQPADVEVGEGAAALTGTDSEEDDLANQLYALPAYRESVQGMCSRSDSLVSIVVNPSLMLSAQDPSSRNTETKLHLEKDMASKTQEKSDHLDIVTEIDSEEEEDDELCRRLCMLTNLRNPSQDEAQP